MNWNGLELPDKPYYSDDAVVIYHADCRDILPLIPDKSIDLMLADPPYGIGKAEWDVEFDITVLQNIGELTNRLGLMCGTWNILDCPREIGGLVYKWTLAAHLVNGMTRGGLGFGNWIPCLVYTSKAYRQDTHEWCCAFTDWCEANNISKNDLSETTNTSDMGGWWMSKLIHRCAVPSPSQWDKIKEKFNPPKIFDEFVAPSDYKPQTDCRDFYISSSEKVNHPSPKPPQVITWLLQTLGGDTILDPFLGSGTTAYCAKKLNRKCIGIEIEEKYCEIASKRCSQSVMELEI